MGQLHNTLTLDEIHATVARVYADITARDADSAFNTVTANLNKIVRVDSPLSYYILTAITPTWVEFTSTTSDDWTELGQTPGSISANLVVQGDSGGTALEFGQALRTGDSPTFANIAVPGNVDGRDVSADGANVDLNTTHRSSDGSDHSGVVLNTTHRSSAGTDHSDVVLNNTHRASDGKNHADVVLNNAHRVSDGKDHSDVVLNNTHRSSDGSDHTFLDQSVTTVSTPTFLKAVIGTTVTPDGTLHVHVGSAGGVTASGVANALVVEDSTNNGLSILTPDASVGRVIFGTPSDPFGAFAAWSFSGSDFAVGTSKIGASFRLTSDQETTNLTLSGGSGSELSTFAKDATINGQIKIAGGTPGNSKYLRSDANGLATWGDIGWTDLGTDVVLLNSSDSVGMGAIPDASAKLEVASTTKGFLPPRMTTTQRDAIISPVAGLSLFDLTLDKPVVRISSEFKTLLTEDLGQVVVQETFSSTNVRFFGELALPAAQGWTDTATGVATIDLVTQTVFGESKQVVRHNDNTTGGSTTSKILLTAQNWIDVNDFGASYSGTARLDTVNGASGFFSGLQANAAENPLATGNRRYGILFNSDAGNLQLIEADNNPGNSVTMDGTGGNPLITFDEWFKWECVVPAGLGAAEVYLNGILTTFVPLFLVNGGGLGTQIIVSSGSTGGTNRIAYHDNFGVTIFEEATTKTLAVATMVGDVAQVNIPEGKRDYTIILPDGNPRLIGSVLRLVANNIGGLISLENQNPAAPEILYNGLRTLVLKIAVKEVIDGINTVNSGNVYIGFKAEDVDRSSAIFAQLHSIIDQIPADVNPTVITYTNHDAINGIGHSTTLNTGELEILPGLEGTYEIIAQPQVSKDSGGVKVDFDMFLQVDRGSGFVDEPNSNIKLTIKDADITDVIVSAITIQLQVADKIRMMQVVSDAAVGMGLKNTNPVVGPPTVPRTPSIIFTMYRIGGI